MLQDLNEILKDLLKQSDVFQEIDISFDAPDSKFANQLQRLTINLFLYDIRENIELRSNDWLIQRQSDGTAVKYQPPVRVDCSYLITVWSKSYNDEYRYLGEVMKVLLRYPKIPNELLKGSFQGKEPPLRTSVLRPPQSQNSTEIWQAMGGTPKTILNYTVTIAVDVNEPIEAGKLVQESIVNYEVKQ